MIFLSPYQSIWPKLFAEEKSQLREALIQFTPTIEHIGSTAIPGIYSKPIIDILIGVPNLMENDLEIIKIIEKFGYHYNVKFEDEFPNRRYFQKNDKQGNRTHQIHLVNYPSAWFEKHILFRDYLRHHTDEAIAYSNLKLELAKKFDNSIDYAQAKTDFCRNIDKLAFFDFKINQPFMKTQRLIGFIPQLCLFELYHEMFTDNQFIDCFGVAFDSNKITSVLSRQLQCWDQRGYGSWVWFEKLTNQFVGEGGLNHTFVDNQNEIELTYSLNKNFWNKGYATEISKATLDFAFNNLQLSNIVCFTSKDNKRSLNVMKKLGFVFEKNFTYAGIPHLLHRL